MMIWALRVAWAVGAILLFGVAVLVHEYGHFLAARLLGFKVDAFSIGFGPAIAKWRRRGVEYRIGCVPLGGYVALPQLDPSEMDAIQGKHSDGEARAPVPPAAPWKRIVVAVAGPLGNVVLAVVVAFVIYFASSPDDFGGIGSTIGRVEAGSAAETAGLRVGDRIVALGGNTVSCWNEVVVECILGAGAGDAIEAVVERGGERLSLPLPVRTDDETGYAEIPGVSPRVTCQVGDFAEVSTARDAGVRKGDVILAIDGVALNDPADMATRVAAGGCETRQFLIRRLRGGEEVLSFAPRMDEVLGRPMVGIVFADTEAAHQSWMMYRRPSLQIANDAKGVIRILRALFAPRARGEASRAAKGMGGAVTLFVVFWMQLQAGLIHTLAFLRYLCVNLAIINILPLPVLDGGHVMFALIEMITRRKPSARLTGWIYNIFAVILISLMAILILRDAFRLNQMFRRSRQAETEQAADETGGEIAGEIAGEGEGETGGASESD